MATISLRRLSDKTIQKYEQLEADGKLSKHQRMLWNNHNIMVGVNGHKPFMEIFLEARKRNREDESEGE